MGTPNSAAETLVKAFAKAQESRQKLKTAIILHKLRQQSASEGRLEGQRITQENQANAQRLRTEAAEAKFNTPEQQYLRRRAMEENPLAAMTEMTEDPERSFEVSQPADKVIQQPSGLYRTKDIAPDSKEAMLGFMTAYDRKVRNGEPVHPVATKLYERMKAKINQTQFGKEKTEKQIKAEEYKPNKSTQDFLDMLSDEVGSGKIKTQDDAFKLLEQKKAQINIRGGDIDHIATKIEEFLPSEKPASKGGGFMGNIAKIGNAIYRKAAGGWKLITEKESEEAPDEEE